jgi:hypothetical protein
MYKDYLKSTREKINLATEAFLDQFYSIYDSIETGGFLNVRHGRQVKSMIETEKSKPLHQRNYQQVLEFFICHFIAARSGNSTADKVIEMTIDRMINNTEVSASLLITGGREKRLEKWLNDDTDILTSDLFKALESSLLNENNQDLIMIFFISYLCRTYYSAAVSYCEKKNEDEEDMDFCSWDHDLGTRFTLKDMSVDFVTGKIDRNFLAIWNPLGLFKDESVDDLPHNNNIKLYSKEELAQKKALDAQLERVKGYIKTSKKMIAALETTITAAEAKIPALEAALSPSEPPESIAGAQGLIDLRTAQLNIAKQHLELQKAKADLPPYQKKLRETQMQIDAIEAQKLERIRAIKERIETRFRAPTYGSGFGAGAPAGAGGGVGAAASAGIELTFFSATGAGAGAGAGAEPPHG